MISVNQFEQALNSLEQSLKAHNQEPDMEKKKMLRDSVIQRFEFCVELAWKTSMKISGISGMAPKPAVREMARVGYIDDPMKWFLFIEARNKSSRTYNEDVAVEVFDVALGFVPEGQKLLRALKQ